VVRGVIYAVFTFIFSLFTFYSKAQLGVNTTGAEPVASAILDASSDSQGLLIPRLSLTSTSDIMTISSPATSLLVYNTTNGNGVAP
jgi:hypothetical protein